MLAPSSYGTYTKVSVQPTLGHHHKRIIRVTHSSLAAPLDQSVGLEEGVVRGVVRNDTTSSVFSCPLE